MMDQDEQELRALLQKRDAVSDDELVARVSSAPELGGSFIVLAARRSRQDYRSVMSTPEFLAVIQRLRAP